MIKQHYVPRRLPSYGICNKPSRWLPHPPAWTLNHTRTRAVVTPSGPVRSLPAKTLIAPLAFHVGKTIAAPVVTIRIVDPIANLRTGNQSDRYPSINTIAAPTTVTPAALALLSILGYRTRGVNPLRLRNCMFSQARMSIIVLKILG